MDDLVNDLYDYFSELRETGGDLDRDDILHVIINRYTVDYYEMTMDIVNSVTQKLVQEADKHFIQTGIRYTIKSADEKDPHHLEISRTHGNRTFVFYVKIVNEEWVHIMDLTRYDNNPNNTVGNKHKSFRVNDWVQHTKYHIFYNFHNRINDANSWT
jgi:hypothetical protein